MRGGGAMFPLLLLAGCAHTLYLGPVRTEPAKSGPPKAGRALIVIEQGKVPARFTDRVRNVDVEALQADRWLPEALKATFDPFFDWVAVSNTVDEGYDVYLHPHLVVDIAPGVPTLRCGVDFRLVARDARGTELAQAHSAVDPGFLFVGMSEGACRDGLDQAYRSVTGELLGLFAARPPPIAEREPEPVAMDDLKVLKQPELTWPSEPVDPALTEARCALQLRIGPDGVPDEVTADEACPEPFAAGAREALLGWRFDPPTRDVVVPIAARFWSGPDEPPPVEAPVEPVTPAPYLLEVRPPPPEPEPEPTPEPEPAPEPESEPAPADP